MNLIPTTHEASRGRNSALTLLELMVAVSMLSFIVLGLYAMFDRTQSALVRSTTQVDVLEAGRATMEMGTREFQQMYPSGQSFGTNLYVYEPLTNGLRQTLIDGTFRTNILKEAFLLTKTTGWHGIAYLIVPMSTNFADINLYNNGVGTLMRIELTTNENYMVSNSLLSAYLNISSNEVGLVLGGTDGYNRLQRVADGVTHFDVRPYFLTNSQYVLTNYFTSNDLPSFVEIELGVLEPKMLEQARGIPVALTQRRFLEDTNRATRVHVFKQRVPVRAALYQ